MKFRTIFPIFLIITIVSVTLRFLQSYIMTDPRTGFFLSEYSVLNFMLTAAFVIVILLLLVFSFRAKELPGTVNLKSAALCAASMFLAFSLMIEGAIMLTGGSFYALSKDTGRSEFQFTVLLGFVLLCLSIIAFLVYGVRLISGKAMSGFLMVFPVFYWAYRLVAAFVTYTGIANISENILYILSICFSLIFLLSHGKVLSDISREKSMKSVLSYGLVSGLFCFVSTVPRFLLMLIGQQDMIHEGLLGKPLDFIFGVYAVVFVLVQMKEEEKVPAEEQALNG